MLILLGQSCDDAPFQESMVSQVNCKTYCYGGSGKTFSYPDTISACCGVGGSLPVISNMDDNIAFDEVIMKLSNRMKPWMGTQPDAPNVPECENEECLNKGFYQLVGEEKVYVDEDFVSMYLDKFVCSGDSEDLDGKKTTCDGCFFLRLFSGGKSKRSVIIDFKVSTKVIIKNLRCGRSITAVEDLYEKASSLFTL